MGLFNWSILVNPDCCVGLVFLFSWVIPEQEGGVLPPDLKMNLLLGGCSSCSFLAFLDTRIRIKVIMHISLLHNSSKIVQLLCGRILL